MKLALIFLFFIGLSFSMAEEQHPPKLVRYYLGLLYKGSNRTQSPDEAEKIQAAHLQHLESLYKRGVLLIAGPMGDDGDLRGIVVLKVDSLENAQAIVNEDPAVKTGRSRVELHPWMSQSLDVLRYKDAQ
jgi:uncharacterized protein